MRLSVAVKISFTSPSLLFQNLRDSLQVCFSISDPTSSMEIAGLIDTVVWKIAIILHVCKCITDGSFIIRLRHFTWETVFLFFCHGQKNCPFTVKEIIQEIIKS